MKKILIACVLWAFVMTMSSVWAYTQNEKLAADFLSYKDVIVAQEDTSKYELDKESSNKVFQTMIH